MTAPTPPNAAGGIPARGPDASGSPEVTTTGLAAVVVTGVTTTVWCALLGLWVARATSEWVTPRKTWALTSRWGVARNHEAALDVACSRLAAALREAAGGR